MKVTIIAIIIQGRDNPASQSSSYVDHSDTRCFSGLTICLRRLLELTVTSLYSAPSPPLHSFPLESILYAYKDYST